jgi:hypothetical protein
VVKEQITRKNNSSVSKKKKMQRPGHTLCTWLTNHMFLYRNMAHSKNHRSPHLSGSPESKMMQAMDAHWSVQPPQLAITEHWPDDPTAKKSRSCAPKGF